MVGGDGDVFGESFGEPSHGPFLVVFVVGELVGEFVREDLVVSVDVVDESVPSFFDSEAGEGGHDDIGAWDVDSS